LHKVILLLNMI